MSTVDNDRDEWADAARHDDDPYARRLIAGAWVHENDVPAKGDL